MQLSSTEPVMPADYEGIGYALEDLACLSRGDNVATRQNSRLWLALEALRGNKSIPPASLSGRRHIHKYTLNFQLFTSNLCLGVQSFLRFDHSTVNIVEYQFCYCVLTLTWLLLSGCGVLTLTCMHKSGMRVPSICFCLLHQSC